MLNSPLFKFLRRKICINIVEVSVFLIHSVTDTNLQVFQPSFFKMFVSHFMNIVVHNQLTKSGYDCDDFINIVVTIGSWTTIGFVDKFLSVSPTTTQLPTTIETTTLSVSWVIMTSCNLTFKIVEITIMILIQVSCKTMIHRDKFNLSNMLKTTLLVVADKVNSPLIVSTILKRNLYICNHIVCLFNWFLLYYTDC